MIEEKNNGFLTVNEAAEIIKVDAESIYRWLNAGILPGAKIGGIWRIRKSDIDAFFEEAKNKPDKDGN